jgi:hypothetical protein
MARESEAQMARGVTQQQLGSRWVLQRGDQPTADKVRAELGTGSPSTLIRLLDVWRANLAKRLAAQARARHQKSISNKRTRVLFVLSSS